MTVRSGNEGELDEIRERRRQPPVPGLPALEGEAERGRARLGLLAQRRIVGLREVDDAPVVPEDVSDQLGMTVEPERPAHERVEVPDEEIGEVERPRLLLLQGIPLREPGVDREAVRAWEPLGSVSFADGVDSAGGATVGL